MDGTISSDRSQFYQNIIEEEGTNLWNNRSKIGRTMLIKGVDQEGREYNIDFDYDNLNPVNYGIPKMKF